MKMSRASLYAVTALASMASQDEPGNTVASHLTAGAQGIPDKFLIKVLGTLARAGVLHSIKGPHGGFRLARPANKITLLEIVEAMDGPIRGEVPPILDGKAVLRLKEVYGQIATDARKQLGKVSLAEFAGKK